MSGITDPSEEYFKDGIWGWATNTWEKLVSKGGRLFTALHGWDGSAWHKLPLLWGYSEHWVDSLVHTKVGDGDYNRDTTAVAAGYVYVLQFATISNTSGARGCQTIRIIDGGVTLWIAYRLTPAAEEPLVFRGPVVLPQGAKVRFYQLGCSNNDEIRTGAWGYKMKIAE